MRQCIAAGSRLNPAAGVMLSALWVASTRQLVSIVHHLAVDGVSWRILLEDLNIAWAQHHSGQQVELPATGPRLPGGRSCWPSTPAARKSWSRRTSGGGSRPPRPRCRRCSPRWIPMPAPGICRCRWMPRPRRLLLGEVPTAFHAGIHDILLIAFALAWAEFLGNGGAPIGIDVEGHGRHDELGPDVDLSRTVGWFTTKYPVALAVGGLSWAQVVAGDAALGAVIKDAKEQLRALPDPADLRSAALSEPRCRPGRVATRRSGSTIWGGWAPRRPRCPAMGGGSARTAWRVSSATARLPMPLAHTVELNAGTVDTEAGPYLQANWMWAPSALDRRAGQPAEPVVV